MDELLKELAKQGPMGLILAASLYANWRQYQDGRVLSEKSATLAGQSLEAIKAAKDETREANGLLQRLLDLKQKQP